MQCNALPADSIPHLFHIPHAAFAVGKDKRTSIWAIENINVCKFDLLGRQLVENMKKFRYIYMNLSLVNFDFIHYSSMLLNENNVFSVIW